MIWWWFGSSWSYCWQASPQAPSANRVATWLQHGVGTFIWTLSSFNCALQSWVISFLLQLVLTEVSWGVWNGSCPPGWDEASLQPSLWDGLPAFPAAVAASSDPSDSATTLGILLKTLLRAAASLDLGLTDVWPHGALSVQTHDLYKSWQLHLPQPILLSMVGQFSSMDFPAGPSLLRGWLLHCLACLVSLEMPLGLV